MVPSGSVEPAPLTVTVRPLIVGVPITAVGRRVGRRRRGTVTVRVVVPVAPLSSVTVRVIV